MERMHFLEKRVYKKLDDYHEYSFTGIQEAALRIFFDLSQEFESIEDLYRICVIVMKAFLNIESMLYVGLNGSSMQLACTYEDGLTTPDKTLISPIMVTSESKEFKGSYFIPIIGNKALVEGLPNTCCGEILGILQLKNSAGLSEKEKFFSRKFANRIGYALHNKVLVWKNINHLKFIRSLVKDIEHNIITPNIAFKLYIRRLRSTMKQRREIEKELGSILTATNINDHQKLSRVSIIYDRIKDSSEVSEEQVKNIGKHYKNTSLFLETLLRRAHFEKGHYVLNRSACNIKEDIIRPLLEEYKAKIKDKHIEIRDEYTVLDKEEPMQVDIGLLSQVYANLFSNALKYIKEVKKDGRGFKYIAYGREALKDYFFNGIHGIKYYVVSTGPNIPAEERSAIFLEGYRSVNVEKIPGTGQGLYFFNEIIRLHGGFVGYEAVARGNKFYFILPKS